MQTIEEIIIRLNADGSKVKTSLDKVGAFVKGWGTSLSHHLKGTFGAVLGVAAFERFFDKLKENILLIDRLSKQSGFGTNFIQGVFQKLKMEGEDSEAIVKPLMTVSALAAQYGKTGTQFLGDMAETYKKLNTQEEKNAYLMSFGIKNWQMLIPLLEEGREGIAKLNQGNFFTKLTPETIQGGKDIWSGIKTEANIAFAVISNGLAKASPLTTIARLARFAGQVSAGSGLRQSWADSKLGQMDPAEARRQLNEADKDGITNSQKYNEVLMRQNDLLRQQRDIRESIKDRGRSTVDDMANEYMKLTGAILPQHTITPAMAKAFRIRTLLEQSKIASEREDWAAQKALMSEHDRLLQSGPFTDRDRNPTRHMEEQLDDISKKLDAVKDLANTARQITGQSQARPPGSVSTTPSSGSFWGSSAGIQG